MTMKPRGFTLLETLVAVTILVLAVAGPLTVAGRALVAAQNARDQLTASYLAQEGIEYVRAARDREFLIAREAGGSDVTARAWQAFAPSGGSFAHCEISTDPNQACTLDPYLAASAGGPAALVSCSVSTCGPLYVNSLGQYRQSNTNGGVVTSYTRTIQGTLVSANNLKVTSTVKWVSRGTSYQATVTSNLTPWQ